MDKPVQKWGIFCSTSSKDENRGIHADTSTWWQGLIEKLRGQRVLVHLPHPRKEGEVTSLLLTLMVEVAETPQLSESDQELVLNSSALEVAM